jgi:hypothetical protein
MALHPIDASAVDKTAAGKFGGVYTRMLPNNPPSLDP